MLSLSVPAACALCRGLLVDPAAVYCCDGCSHVARILAASGYAGDPLASEAFRQARSAGVVRFDALGGARPSSASSAERRTIRLRLDGLWCASCAWLIEAIVGRAPGVLSAKVSFLADQAEFDIDPMLIDRDGVAAQIRSLGYAVLEDDARKDRGPLLRFGVAAFFSSNVMTLSYAYYAARWSALIDLPPAFIPWLLVVLTAPVVFICGGPILRRGWRALLNRSLVMDSLIALGAVSAYVFSVAAVLRGGRDVYFDGASGLITFWLLGRALEHEAFRRVSEAAEAVRMLLPRKALRVAADGESWVAASELRPGDRIRVSPGERVPVDGVVASGRGRVSTAVVDGEARPRDAVKGDRVPGGSVCAESALELEVLVGADESLLARIADHVGRLSGRRGGIDDPADALARLFIPAVLLLSAVTAAACALRGMAPSAVLERALSVLVVSCPCAIGVAAPLARVIAAGVLARRGVIVRGEGVLDRVARTRWVALDKTGTLTEGLFRLEGLRTRGASDEEALDALTALERPSGHPVAQALRQLGRAPAFAAEDVRVIPGKGVRGLLIGAPAIAGSPEWVSAEEGTPPAELLRYVESSRSRGATAILVRWGKDLWAAAAFGDTLRPEASGVVSRLKAMGLGVCVLSGDSASVARRAASAAGIEDAYGGLLPEEKVQRLMQLETLSGRCAIFVGDGINDAPALAAAIGVSVAGGTDFARESAEILFLESGLEHLVDLVEMSRRMDRIIRQNLAWAASYNIVALPAAMLGLLNPVMASAAMVLSGLLVIMNSFRIQTGPLKTVDLPRVSGVPGR